MNNFSKRIKRNKKKKLRKKEMNIKNLLLLIVILGFIFQFISCKAIETEESNAFIIKKQQNTENPILNGMKLISKLIATTFGNILLAFKKFTELKIFDSIHIKISTVVETGKDGNLYHVPVDNVKNHYFIGK